MEFVSIDLWAANLEPVVPDLQVWLAALEMQVAQTVARGGHILVLPEFACAQWLSFAPADMAEADTLEWLFECGEVALDAIAAMSAKHGVSILAGTIPFLTEPECGTIVGFDLYL